MKYLIVLLISFFTMTAAHAVEKNVVSTPAPIVKTTTITVYENPVATSKVLATFPSGQALIPIFTQGDWVKVANPQNGMVGWTLKNSLNNATTVTITQQSPGVHEYMITQKNTDGSNGNIYRVIQYSNSGAANQMNAEQLQAIFKNIQLQQQQMQADFNKMFNDTFHNMGQMSPNGVFQSFPVMPPVIIIQQPPTTVPKK